MFDMTTTQRYRQLADELWAVAYVELQEEIDNWDNWTPAQLARLQAYLRDELAPGGMLSVDKARESGLALSRERDQARRILKLRPADA